MLRALCSTLVVAAVLAPGVARAADAWTDPFPGVRRLHRTTSSQNINVLKVDLCAPGVSVRTTATGERQRTVSSFAGLVGAQAAVNGDFFSFTSYDTNGPAMHGGQAWGGNDHAYVAPVQFGANHVALPGHEGTGGVEAWAREVVSGHPSLLVGGARRDNNGDSLCTTRNPRTALGFSADRRTLFVAVVDGRATGRIGMTCDELVALFSELGAADAVNLDGGGSSTMWVQGPGVVNYPSDGSQRVVANHLAIMASGSGAAAHCPVPAYAASFVTLQAPPATMVSGDEAVVWMEYKNEGNTVWDLDKTRLGTQQPQDRASPFFKDGNWIAPNRPTGADHSNYGPGAVGRFSWVMLAPEVTQPTTFEEAFQPLQEGVTWFGPVQTMSITVMPRAGTGPDAGDGEGGDEEQDGDAGVDGASSASGGCSTGGAGGGGAAAALVLAIALGLRRRRS